MVAGLSHAETATASMKRPAYYRLPADFTVFKPVATADIKASLNTLPGKVIDSNWYTPAAERIIGKPCPKGVSFETNVTGARILFLLFNGDYAGEVLDGITMKQTKQDIIRKLGAPQFEDSKLKVFGYKGKQCYVFFTGEAAIQTIAVYRRDTDYDKDLIRRYASGERFQGEGEGHYGMLWAESDGHYSAGVQCDEYIAIGAKINSDLASYIRIYNNFEGTVADGISVPENYAALQAMVCTQGELPDCDDGIVTLAFEPDTDSVFAYECERQTRIIESIKNGILSSDKKKVLAYDGCTGGNASIYIYFLDGSHPTIRHYTGFLNYYTWLNDRYVIHCGEEGRSPIQVFDIVSQETFIVEHGQTSARGAAGSFLPTTGSWCTKQCLNREPAGR
jgi:hypothetical protein